MVLGMTMLITVIGMGALATSRVTGRAAGVSVDWQEAGSTAFSAAEHAIARLNAEAAAAPTTWRNAYTSGTRAVNDGFGGGRLRWLLVDEDDGVLNDDYADGIKLYGIGVVNTTTRVYSVQLSAGGDALDVLRTTCHAAGNLVLTGTVTTTGGPVSSNANIVGTAPSGYRGTSEAAGTGGAAVTPVKPMPNAGVFEAYKARAKTISSAVAGGGSIQPGTLSAASNPYGDEDEEGIYYLPLPDTIGTLNILSSSIKGTLLIEAAAGATNQQVVIDGAMLWEPHGPKLPSLITKGVRTVTINGSIAPFDDGSGTAKASELRGLFHTIGSADVQLTNGACLRGCLIADGVITVTGAVGLIADPTLFAQPPTGYTKGNLITPVPGTWKWDEPPAGG